MPCTLIVRGGEIELHEEERFNKIRHRLNQARKLSEDYKNGSISGNGEDGQKFQPFHVLTFRTSEDGRLAVDIENVIGVMSDEARDGGSNEEDDE